MPDLTSAADFVAMLTGLLVGGSSVAALITAGVLLYVYHTTK